jgi:DNA-binding CsgD family transcriptional regulator
MDRTAMANEIESLANEKLDRILMLLGVLAVKGLTQTEQIAMLSRTGFTPKEIADVIGTTSNTVRVALVGIRRAGKSGRGRNTTRGKEASNE